MIDKKTKVEVEPSRILWAWALFDWAAQPFFTLILTFIFAPYFAKVLVGDVVYGQVLWGYGQAGAGLFIAIFAPLVGALIDTGGLRKTWLSGFSVLIVISCALLWWASPSSALPLGVILTLIILAQFGVEMATMVTNAMLPDIAPYKRGGLSGSGMALGYLGGLLSLVIMLAFFMKNPLTGQTMLGLAPMIGSSAEAHIAERLVGPFTAIWYVIFIIPLFWLVPERQARRAVGGGLRACAGAIGTLLACLRADRDMVKFLVSRMAYQDGLVALFAFGGIYAAGSLGWGANELGVFGILMSVSAGIGAYFGGILDDRFGSKKIIATSLVLLIVCVSALAFIGPYPEKVPLFSASGRAFLLVGLLLGLGVGPAQAASRTLLIALAPRAQITGYFGIFAFSGKASAFLAPLLVAIATSVTGSLKAGLFVIVALFVIGLGLLALVRVPERR